MTTAEGAIQEPSSCWCCGRPAGTQELLHLNAHPEAAVCLTCADFLVHRASERRDQLHPTWAARGRDVLRAGRSFVMRHGWQGLPVVGPVLRRLGRHLP